MSQGSWLLQGHVLTYNHYVLDVLSGFWDIQKLSAVSQSGTTSELWSKHQTGNLHFRLGCWYSSGRGTYHAFFMHLTNFIFFCVANL